MGIKEGYKKTDVGLVPNDWDICEVQDAYEICNNLRFPISENDRKGMQGKYPYYGPTKIQDHINEYRLDGEYALIGEDGDHFLKWSTTPMTLLATGKFNVNNHAHIVKGLKNETKWFYWYFNRRDITPFLSRQGAGRYKLNKRTLKTIKMATPPLPEQQAIANALSGINELINSLTKLINKKKNIKRGVMQELLTGNKRLEGFSGERVEKHVYEFGTITTGSTPSTLKPEYWNGNIPWITPTDINEDKNIINSERKITKQGLNAVKELKTNTVLITCIASIGKNAILRKVGACNQQINAITPNNEYNADFIYYLFEINKHYLLSKAGITATNIVSKTEFSTMIFKVPPTIEEQTAIANILSDMDSEIESMQNKLAKYKALKQGMMQELLTGRIRLVEEVMQ